MRKRIQHLLQKLLGFETYLYCVGRMKIGVFKARAYEPEFFEWMKLLPGGAILDVGANVGITTIPLAKQFPGAHVHAFEPIPANIKTLKRIIKHYGTTNVKVHEVALGAENGVLKLVLPVIQKVRMQGLSHAYVEGKDDEWNTGEMFDVAVNKLDEVEALKNEQKIAAIKIDVENYEYYVLKGARQLLLKHRPLIYCELWDNEMKNPVLDLMHEYGYNAKIFETGKLVDFTGQPALNFVFTPQGEASPNR